MSDEALYSLTLNGGRNNELLRITGTRESVVETALRVILDCAPQWTPQSAWRPLFTIDAWRVDP